MPCMTKLMRAQASSRRQSLPSGRDFKDGAHLQIVVGQTSPTLGKITLRRIGFEATDETDSVGILPLRKSLGAANTVLE
eukprot:4516021-Pleurochrysis_carterae.AAC.1